MPGSADAPAADLVQGFANGFVFELVDIREQQPLQVHVLVLNPQHYELTEPHASVLTPTEGNTVVDESVGIIQRTITIEGTFGAQKRAATAFEGAQNNGQPQTGSDHFKDLRDMFRRYSLLKQSPGSAAYVRLILHVLRDDDHFILAQPQFVTPRDYKMSRLTYYYRITAQAIGDAFLISKLRRRNAQNAGDLFTDATRQISNGLNDARAAFAEVSANVGLIRRKIGNINTILVNVGQLLNAVSAATSGTIDTFTQYPMRIASTAISDTFIQYPLRLAASVADQVADAADYLAVDLIDSTKGPEGEASRSLREMEDALNRIMAFPERFAAPPSDVLQPYRGERDLTERDLVDGTAGATIGSRTRATRGSESEAGFDLSAYRGVRTVRLTRTDTLESLGARHDCSPELIVIVNDLRAPYLAPGGGPGLLAPGDDILIPTREGTGGSGGSSADYVSVDDALYGVDLAIDMDLLNRTGVLDFRVPPRDAGDAEHARGIANVVQGTAVSIFTERGSTTFLPDVGINRNVGRKGTIQHVVLASLNLREAILSDSRIEGISESEVVLDGDVLTQEIKPIVKGSHSDVTLVLPFGRASGGA